MTEGSHLAWTVAVALVLAVIRWPSCCYDPQGAALTHATIKVGRSEAALPEDAA